MTHEELCAEVRQLRDEGETPPQIVRSKVMAARMNRTDPIKKDWKPGDEFYDITVLRGGKLVTFPFPVALADAVAAEASA